MDSMVLLSPIFSLLAIAAIVGGLAFAGRMLPKVIDWIRNDRLHALLSRPLARLVLWVSLGTLFTFPLIDFLSGIRYLISIILPTSAPFTTAFGSVSFQVFSTVPVILLVIVYGGMYWLTRSYLTAEGQLSRLERFFIISSAASMVYWGINSLLTYVYAMNLPINIQQNFGLAGIVAQVMVGLALLAAILVGLNFLLPGHPLNQEK